MKKLRLFVLLVLLGSSLVAKAVAPILIAEGIELILAGSGTAVTLPTATATGVSAAWTGVVTALGAGVAYFALKDATNTASVAVPSNASATIPPPAAPSTAPAQSLYTANSGGACGSVSSSAQAAAESCCSANAASFVSLIGSNFTCHRGDPYNYDFTGTVGISSTGCPSGYTDVSGTCTLSNARAATDDGRCDLSRSGATWAYSTGDLNCGSGSPMRGTINGDTITVQGKDSFGNPVIHSIQATTDGGTVLHQQVQVVDANGNTAIVDKTARFDSSGNYVGQTQALLSGSLAVDPVTGTITPQAAPAGSATPSSSLSNLQFPNDYNREVTQQAVLTKLGEIKTQLVETSTAPGDPVARTGSEISSAFFPSTFIAIQSWSLPVHAAACPVITFDAFGSSYTVNSHCALIDANAPLLANAFLIMWALAAMFIVLRA